MNYIKHVTSEDGTMIHMKVNDIVGESAKATVIIVHGLAESLERYDEITNYLNANQFNVVRYDQRGHGHSGGQQTFYSGIDEIVEDLSAVVNYVKETFEGKVYLLGHSMGGYTVTLFGTKHPNMVDGIITSGALTRYQLELFGYPDRSIPPETYVANELGQGVCSDPDVMKKYELDDLNAKRISMGLIFTLLDGIEYLKANAEKFIDNILILHGKEDGLVSYKDSLQLFNEIGSEHKSIHIYDGLQHEILNESSYNQNIFAEIVAWLENELER
ncbi:alpha/beta hydrolase [Staphylococcus muscae]|nr:alpha/beta hydrolase [Staphylococcus muscae]AVQ33923.1 alpha/beta hydrolase [Staphylococcus muscae]PNZ04547.1 alpha/beta hydrolase [Staphylococcus muscae]GGA83219.1 lysophospholipase [Staphylococcus muscae]